MIIRKGKIKQVVEPQKEIEEITNRLTGCRFHSQDMYKVLLSSEKPFVQDVAQFLLEQRI